MRLSKEREQMYATGARFSSPPQQLCAMLTLAVSDESPPMHKGIKELASRFLLLPLLISVFALQSKCSVLQFELYLCTS